MHGPGTILDLDATRTKVEFTLGDVLHTVHGSFKLKNGSIQFDPASGQASGAMVVDAASGASGSGARDRRMQKNILETKNFPKSSSLRTASRATCLRTANLKSTCMGNSPFMATSTKSR